MFPPAKFDSIRCYDSRDLARVFAALAADESFQRILGQLYGDKAMPAASLAEQLAKCQTTLDFQRTFIYPLVRNIISQHTDGTTFDASALPDKSVAYTFISNHRDIVLDPALLSLLMLDAGFTRTPQIAIGDNLLAAPWIEHVVRLNRAFIVRRSLNMRETLQASQLMSEYMHFTLLQTGDPIWIAQREGRAKDSNDRTQPAVLRMLAMGGEGTPAQSLAEMNIVPLALSYEYDPCDYLKAREFQLKRDNPDYCKTREEDVLNMQTGIFGYKGRVRFVAAPCIGGDILQLADLPKNDFFRAVAERIDTDIHRRYHLFPGNYVAADLLAETPRFANRYTPAEKATFEAYVQQQLQRIQMAEPDWAFLRERLLTMYANPVHNHLAAHA